MHSIISIFSSRFLFPLWSMIHKASLLLMGYSYVHHNETNLMLALQRFYKNKKIIFFDIGLNIGAYTKEIYEIFNSNMVAYGFEPVMGTYQMAEKTLTGIPGIHIYQHGMADSEKDIDIHFNTIGEGTASIVGGEGTQSEKIHLRTVDEFVIENSVEHIDFMKVDVEGYEYFVLQGAMNMIEQGKIDIIQFEFFRTNIDSKVFFRDFWDLLSSRYTLYRILNNSLKEITHYHPADCEIFLGMNYLAVKKGVPFVY